MCNKKIIAILIISGTSLFGIGCSAKAETNSTDASLPSITVLSDYEQQHALEEIRRTPGGVGIRFGEDYREKGVIGIGDALADMPGVYVQRPSGQESARISIRGSGISASGIRGLRLLRDGLPLGRLDDLNEAIYADVLSANRIEVYRGASSLQYGASTLGGAINLISSTAYSDPGGAARIEGGSDGVLRTQLKGGKVFSGGLDAYVSVSHYETDGFRENSAEHSSRLYANLGYAFSATSRGRFHLTEERYQSRMPGLLSLAQVQNNPRMANPSNLDAKASIRTAPRWHLAYQHELDLGNADKISLGVFRTGTKFDSPSVAVRAKYDAVDYGIAMRHEINRSFDGNENRFVWGINYSRGSGENTLSLEPNSLSPSPTFGTVEDRRSNTEVFAENSLKITPRLTLVVGSQISRSKRDTDNHTPYFITEYPDGSASRTYDAFNPKIGAIWDLENKNSQIYANLSRSHEAPSSLAFYKKYSLFPEKTGTLEAQKATTVEIGTRGGKSAFAWDVALYRSRVDKELLEQANMTSSALPAVSVNATSPTLHTGIELGLNGRQTLPAWSGMLDWNLTYGWNHFRFDQHALYGNNKLPGIPDHVLQASIVYRHVNGFYIGPSVSLGSSWYADQANTLRAPGYGIINLSSGYVLHKDLRFFVDIRNLANKYYAATSDFMVDARVPSTSTAVFRPGQIRAVIVGVEAKW